MHALINSNEFIHTQTSLKLTMKRQKISTVCMTEITKWAGIWRERGERREPNSNNNDNRFSLNIKKPAKSLNCIHCTCGVHFGDLNFWVHYCVLAQCNNVMLRKIVTQGSKVKGICALSCSQMVEHVGRNSSHHIHAVCLFDCHYFPP